MAPTIGGASPVADAPLSGGQRNDRSSLERARLQHDDAKDDKGEISPDP